MATWTPDELLALQAAISRGVLEVQYGDRRVRYHSLTEMLKLLAVMEGAAAAASGVSANRFAAFSKGTSGAVARDWASGHG